MNAALSKRISPQTAAAVGLFAKLDETTQHDLLDVMRDLVGTNDSKSTKEAARPVQLVVSSQKSVVIAYGMVGTSPDIADK